ncbi:HAMP domain-containing protein [Haloglomus litoreum]|uniref:HAMP domain-containing protein n=1 Tax=Haloglomus litoreum TaxID=3034026 RepID=UPI0023E83087|nr:HAMP domain-containing protein [Haloglomus sp. DT116]
MRPSIPGAGPVLGFVRVSYRRKLAAVLLVVLLISGVAAVGLYLQVGALLDDNVEQSMTAATNAEAGELTEWSRQNRLLARVISEHPVYEEDDRTAVRRYLQRQLVDRREAHVVNAYVIDRRNQTVETSALQSLEGTAVEDLPWQQQFAFRAFDDVRTTKPHEADGGETVVLGYVTPIRGAPGHLLVVTIDTASIFERFEHPVDGGFTRVVDSNGTVVFADNRSAMLRQYQPGPLRSPVVSRGLQGESGFVADPRYEQSAPGTYVAAFAPVDGTDLVVIEHAPTSEAYAITREAGLWIGLISTIAVVGLLGVVSVIGADVTGALATLADRAERIEQGEYDVAFDTDRPDEFGDLNRTMARTRDTLRKRIEEIEETKGALEASNVALETRSTMVSVLNRILRHNVRTDINIIAGRASVLAEQVTDEAVREGLEDIRQQALSLATLSDRTRRVQNILSEASGEREQLRFPDCLEAPLEDIRASWPEATITVERSESGRLAHGTASLPVAIADVVDQILAHNDGGVAVSIAVAEADDGESLLLTIDDDGDGLPALDIEAVGLGEETPLEHAEGLALWCLEWTVTQAGGELVTDTPDGTLTVWLPAAEPGATEDEEESPEQAA